MPRKRLTREESRDQTRERLLSSAAVIIAKKGIAAASVEDITAHAGYTRGAFYSNFESKLDLFIELLKRDHENIHQDLQRLLDTRQPIEDIQRQLTLHYLQAYRDSSNFILWAEARLLALRDAKFRARLNAYCLEKREGIAHIITQFYEMTKRTPPAPPGDLAFGAMALIDGMRFFNASMPAELPDEAAQQVLEAIFNATFFS
jgi:AcrR family transcriptional regulator